MKHSTNLNHTNRKRACNEGLSSRVYKISMKKKKTQQKGAQKKEQVIQKTNTNEQRKTQRENCNGQQYCKLKQKDVFPPIRKNFQDC